MLHIAGIILSLFLALLLFTKKGTSKADFILAAWLVLISFHLLCYYLLASGSYATFPYLLGLEIPLPLIHGPFLYLYTAALVNQQHRRPHWVVHFIPAALAFLLLSGFYIEPFDQKIYVYENRGIGHELATTIIRFPIIPSGILYVVLSLLLLKKHSANIARQFSYSEKINLRWLVYLTIGMGVIWLSVIFGNDVSTFALVDLFVLFIGYFGIKQVGIFTNQPAGLQLAGGDAVRPGEPEGLHSPAPDNEAAGEEDKVKYQKTAISQELMTNIHRELTLLMQQEKIFQHPELSLDELAGRLGVTGNTLSQVINAMEQRNFYDYVNNFRIKEFQRIVALPGNDQFTLLSLAFEVGFNSKTSFNRNFKKATGLSPREYCRQEKIRSGEQD